MVSNSKSSSSRTISAESSTNPPPSDIRRVGRLRVTKNKATSALKRPQINPNHPQSSNMYSCNLCTEKFSTYQALGGHQNAHRRERLLQKCLMVMEFQEHMDENNHQPNPSILPNNNNNNNSPIVYSPIPLRVAYPLTEFQKVVPPPHHLHQPSFGLKFQGPSSMVLRPIAFGGLPDGWIPYMGLPRPIIHDFQAHVHDEPSFPPGFGVHHHEHGGSSSAAIVPKVEEEEVEEGKESWGRHLKLWP